MSDPVLLLVLLAALMHAVWNYLAKTIPSGVLFVWLLAAVVSVLLLPFAAGYVLLYGFEWSAVNVMVLLASGVLHLIYFAVLQQGYRVSDLSVVYPLARGSGPLFSTVGAVWFLHETVSGYSMAGLAAVVAGVLLIAGILHASADAHRRRLGVYYGVATGVLIASYTVLDGYAVKNLALAPLLIDYTSHPLRVLALAPVARKRWPEVRALWQGYRTRIIIIAIMSPLAFILVLYAMKTAPVHFVAPLRETSIVFGVIFGAKLLTEENFKPRLAGSLLILTGIVLLSV